MLEYNKQNANFLWLKKAYSFFVKIIQVNMKQQDFDKSCIALLSISPL